MMKKHLHVKLAAESILDMIYDTSESAMKKGLDNKYLCEEKYREIIGSDSQELSHKIREHLYGTVECRLLDIIKLSRAYFEARGMDENLLITLMEKSRE